VERLRLPGHRAVRYALQLDRACQKVLNTLEFTRSPVPKLYPAGKITRFVLIS
jgi:hypothetical protein